MSKPAKTPQQVRQDQIGTITFNANQKQVLELPRGPVYYELGLNLRGAPTLTGGNNTLAKTLRGDAWGCLDRLEVVANGGQIIRTYTPDFLRWHNLHLGLRPYVSPTIGDGSTANPTINEYLSLPFAWPNQRSARGADFALPTAQFSKLELHAYWNTYTGINADASAWTTNPYIEVSYLYRFGNPTLKYAPTVNRMVTQTYSGAATDQDVRLTVNRIYRQLLINVQNSSNVDAGAILTGLDVRSGSTIFRKYTETVLRQQYRTRAGMGHFFERALASGTGGIGQPFQSAKSALDGWYMIDFADDGYNTECLDTRGLTEAVLRLQIAAQSTVKIMSFEIGQ